MITQSELKELLNYNPDTGEFTWLKTNSNRIKIGDIAGYNDHNGYRIIRVLKKKQYKAHILAWLYVTGEYPKQFIDHINNVPSDNRWSNLRLANNSQNGANRLKYQNNKSGYKGVSWCKISKKWKAQITHNGKTKYIGLFSCQIEAYKAYCDKAKELHKEFACFG
jgi:hypothetical protein